MGDGVGAGVGGVKAVVGGAGAGGIVLCGGSGVDVVGAGVDVAKSAAELGPFEPFIPTGTPIITHIVRNAAANLMYL